MCEYQVPQVMSEEKYAEHVARYQTPTNQITETGGASVVLAECGISQTERGDSGATTAAERALGVLAFTSAQIAGTQTHFERTFL